MSAQGKRSAALGVGCERRLSPNGAALHRRACRPFRACVSRDHCTQGDVRLWPGLTEPALQAEQPWCLRFLSTGETSKASVRDCCSIVITPVRIICRFDAKEPSRFTLPAVVCDKLSEEACNPSDLISRD